MPQPQSAETIAAPARPGWITRLSDCRTADEVLGVARAYLARLSYYEVLCLPERCRPRALHAPGDICAYWLDLFHAAHGESETAAPAIQRLAAFFARADARLTQLVHAASDDIARKAASNNDNEHIPR